MVIEKNSKIVFFGDSLTRRSWMKDTSTIAKRYALDYCESYVDILLKKILVRYPELEIEAYSRGVGGDTTADLLKRVEEDVLNLNPDWVVLFIGQNDAQKGYSLEEYQSNLIKLLELFKHHNIQVIQLSTTPCPDPEKEWADKMLDKFDNSIAELSAHYGTIYVDVKKQFKHIKDHNRGDTPSVHVFNEGCHFSELGNILVAELVLDAMRGIQS